MTAPRGPAYARILSVGGYRPSRVLTNDDVVAAGLDSSDDWIRERSGITERRFAGPEETVPDMAAAAAEKALAASGVPADRIGMVLLGSMSHHAGYPAAAAEVAHRIGAVNAAAMDLGAACAGFCYALATARDMVVAGSAEYVLVVGSEKMSDIIDPTDRGTAFIFGDGAGAVVVGPSDIPAMGPVVWGSDGGAREAIMQSQSWFSFRDNGGEFPTMRMQGQQVFRWAVGDVSKVAVEALAASGLTPADLDVFIPHQANIRITDAMLRTLKLPDHVKIARDIVTSGNTSAASIPLAMERMLEAGEISSGDTALVIGFGAGLAYAALVVTVP
ncbi:MAG: ketoacyl-ACP synthase III [Actinomycetota bacterium]|nr:MAG: ketoacyl-ACP synthase III [Actinomycetota bacterium]